jgi:hypothetical protein
VKAVTLLLCLIGVRPITAAAAVVVRIDILIAGSDSDVQRLQTNLTEAAQQAGVSANMRKVIHIDPREILRRTGVPTLWIDREMAGKARLYLTSADGSRVFVRDFELANELDPVALELLNLVVQSSLKDLISGTDLGVPRAEYERTLPPEPALPKKPAVDVYATRKKPSLVLHAGAFYEIAWLSAHTVEHGPGVELQLDLGPLNWGVAGQWRFPVLVNNANLDASLRSRTLRGFVAYPFRLSSRADLAFGAALGVDWIEVRPRGRAELVSARSNFLAADGVLRLQSSFRYRFHHWQVGGLLGAERGLVRANYYDEQDGNRQPVFTPWPFRPLASVSLSAFW